MARFKKMVIAGTVPGLSDAKQTEASGPEMQPKTVVAVARSAGSGICRRCLRRKAIGWRACCGRPSTLTVRRWPGRRSRQRRGCAARCPFASCRTRPQDSEPCCPIPGVGSIQAKWSIPSGRSRRPTSTSTWQQPQHRADCSHDQRRYILYRTGRQLHPQQFPAAMPKNGPPRQQRPIATRSEISRLQSIIPRLPAGLGRRAQTFCWISVTGPGRGRRISGTTGARRYPRASPSTGGQSASSHCPI